MDKHQMNLGEGRIEVGNDKWKKYIFLLLEVQSREKVKIMPSVRYIMNIIEVALFPGPPFLDQADV